MKLGHPINLPNRRHVLKGIAATGLSASSSLSAQDVNRRGWIDAHVHVWSPDTRAYPLGPDFDESSMMPKSFTPEQLLEHCRPSGVTRIVLIQMSFYQLDHSYMFDAMNRFPGVFSGVALINHRSTRLREEVLHLKGGGVRGFRIHSRGDAKSWVDDEGMNELWRIAAREGLAVCPLINPEDLPIVDALCQRHQDTKVVVDHFARIGIAGTVDANDLASLCRLARFKNAHVKTSAFYALGQKKPPYRDLIPMIRRVVDAFGPSRLMWASDCPFQVQGEHGYDESIALIRDEIKFLSESDKNWMLRDTAEKVYF